ncbi:MAG: hypothetical protein DRO99_02190 [Candidatus Aenigmatarchaeota archaeon]|nr:MAG: hypothetical protein DRO99_02190 [Candidatus Aenigmarchaeota archaeon]
MNRRFNNILYAANESFDKLIYALIGVIALSLLLGSIGFRTSGNAGFLIAILIPAVLVWLMFFIHELAGIIICYDIRTGQNLGTTKEGGYFHGPLFMLW